jgi:hypothetical protein
MVPSCGLRQLLPFCVVLMRRETSREPGHCGRSRGTLPPEAWKRPPAQNANLRPEFAKPQLSSAAAAPTFCRPDRLVSHLSPRPVLDINAFGE